MPGHCLQVPNTSSYHITYYSTSIPGLPLVYNVCSMLTHSDPLDFTPNLEGPWHLALPLFPHLPG